MVSHMKENISKLLPELILSYTLFEFRLQLSSLKQPVRVMSLSATLHRASLAAAEGQAIADMTVRTLRNLR